MEATGDVFEPFRLVDADGEVVAAAAAFIAELAACGRPAATQRSYGMDLLRWFRFLWALGIGWDQATRVEARDFCRWLQIADKSAHPHWRHAGRGPARSERMGPPATNPVTGKSGPGERFAAATVAHCESVLRGFYDFHLEAGTGPMVNPASGPGVGGVLGVDRGAGGGTARCHRRRCRPGPAVDQRGA